MSRPTEPPVEFLRRENIMGVRKGVSARAWTPLTPVPKCPELLDAPWTAQPLVEEIAVVDVDQLGPGEHADDASDRQEDAEGHGLLARGRALAGDDGETRDGPYEERRQQGWEHGQAQVQTHRPGELHVAHAHPAGIGDRSREHEGEGPPAGDQVLDEVAPVH